MLNSTNKTISHRLLSVRRQSAVRREPNREGCGLGKPSVTRNLPARSACVASHLRLVVAVASGAESVCALLPVREQSSRRVALYILHTQSVQALNQMGFVAKGVVVVVRLYPLVVQSVMP